MGFSHWQEAFIRLVVLPFLYRIIYLSGLSVFAYRLAFMCRL